MKLAIPLPPAALASAEVEGEQAGGFTSLALPPEEWEGVGSDSPGLTHL